MVLMASSYTAEQRGNDLNVHLCRYARLVAFFPGSLTETVRNVRKLTQNVKL